MRVLFGWVITTSTTIINWPILWFDDEALVTAQTGKVMILYNVHAKCVGNGPVWPSFLDVLLNLCVFSIYFPDAQQSSCVLCVFLSAMDSHEIGRTCMHKSSLLLLLFLKFMTILSCDSSVHVISKESCTQPEYMFERRSFHTKLTYIVFLHESKSTLWNQTCIHVTRPVVVRMETD